MIVIPDEIQYDNELSWPERVLLSIYKFYTEDGELHCCLLGTKKLMAMADIGRSSFFNAKKHLRELGYIECEGDIKVTYCKKC